MLDKVSQFADVYLFTASEEVYANKLLSVIDPTGKVFKRKFFKGDCIRGKNGQFIKDLTILKYPLERIVLVDNSTFSFCYQLFNGIPIINFEGSAEDTELSQLSEYLESLVSQADVRRCNAKYFKLDYYFRSRSILELFAKLFKS